jgi:TP901 family phage tail tape measure protein
MSEFVAGAFVDVKPDTKGFRDALKTQVNASIKSAGVFKVPIQFEIKAFKKQLQDAARQAKPVIPVTIGGNIATIRKDLNDKIQKATTGLAFKVPVEFTQTGAGSRGGAGGTGGTGGTGGRGGSGGSRKALTEDEKQAITVAKALDAAQVKQIATANALASAIESGLSADERAIRLSEARTTANAGVRVTTDALARSEETLTGAQRVQLEAARNSALVQRASVVEKQKELKLAAATATTTTKVTEARAVATTVMAVEVKEVGTLNELHVLENELLAAEATLKRTTNKARELGLTSLAAENDLLLANIAERKALIATQRQELKGEGLRSRQQKTGLRGIAATALSQLGLRGATLAATGAFLVGAAAATIFTKSLKAFATFETELNTFQAVAGATAEQMKEVSRTASELGADITLPAVSAADAAKAMTELARAGLDVRDSLAGARGVLELAAAAQISNADAATLVASGLNAFSLSGEEAVHVADLLANAANAAQGSISEMGAALQQAAAISHQVGLSLDDTVAILTLFAKNGLRGSDAGTSLRTALARLIAPTTKASAVIADLGLNIRDANGNVRPEVFADFAEATKDLTPALRDMLAETIAGQDSIRAFAIGGREGARGLKLARLEMAQQGTAAQVAAARTKGLGGQFSSLASNAETLGIKLGSVLAPPVELVTSDLNNLFSVMNKFASGDFGGGLKEFLDFKGRETKQRLTGLKDIFSPRTGPEGKIQGLKELFGGVEKEKTPVDNLLEQLDALQKIRITAVGAGIPVGPITAQIKAIRAELHKAKVDAGLLVPVTPLEKIKAPFQETIKQAQEARRELQKKGQTPSVIAQIAALDQLIKASTPRMRAAVEKFKSEANKAMTGLGLAKKFDANFKAIATNIDFATPEILGSLDDLISDIKKVPVGSAPKALGLKIVKNIQNAINAAVDADDPALAAAILAKAEKIAALFGISLAEAFKKLKIPLTADDVANLVLPEQIAGLRAEAAGNVSGQIAAKQAELAGLNKGLAGVRKGTQNEADVLSDIIGVQGEIASLQQEAVSGADTKVLDAISDKEQALQNQLTLAQTTKSLTDDLKAERRLRAFYIKQIEIVAQTVKDKQTRNDAIKDLNQKLFDLDLDIAGTIRDRAEKIFDDAAQAADETVTLADDLRVANRRVRFWENQVKILKDLVRKRKATAAELQVAQDSLDAAEKEAKKALQDRRRQQRENRQERLDLKIQIAQDNGNVRAEIVAREAQIRNTKALIRQTRRGSLQRLRLIAELRKEQRELRDLKKEKEKSAKEAQAVIFAFLQAQQGFAANLLSNLVPFHIADGTLGPQTSGSTSSPASPTAASTLFPDGRRSEVSPPPVFPAEALAREASVQAATKPQQGFTNTQVSRLLALQAQVVSLLGGRVSKDSHPHAKTQAKRSGGSSDVD